VWKEEEAGSLGTVGENVQARKGEESRRALENSQAFRKQSAGSVPPTETCRSKLDSHDDRGLQRLGCAGGVEPEGLSKVEVVSDRLRANFLQSLEPFHEFCDNLRTCNSAFHPNIPSGVPDKAS
jgi:hypothetical protein